MSRRLTTFRFTFALALAVVLLVGLGLLGGCARIPMHAVRTTWTS